MLTISTYYSIIYYSVYNIKTAYANILTIPNKDKFLFFDNKHCSDVCTKLLRIIYIQCSFLLHTLAKIYSTRFRLHNYILHAVYF